MLSWCKKNSIRIYMEICLKDLENNTIRDGSKLLNVANRLSLLAIVAYSFKHDIDLDDWIVQYFNENDNYILNQKENYLHMKEHLDKFVKGMVA